MPPRRFSRHTFTEAYLDTEGDLVLTDPEPFRFRNLEDNRIHVVKQGDTLWNLAAHYYRELPRPAGLWWVIADFQPDPIHDPTVALPSGMTVVIPSLRTVIEEVFSEKRREE